jgi:outer membrane protein assembly factor BamE
MKRLLPVLLISLLSACSNTPSVTSYLTPYKIDVRQGNMVTQDMVAQLKPGLTRDQVRFILGTPLVADMFHADRWDYIYRFQPGRGEVQERHLIVFFEGNKLLRLGGDIVANPPAGEATTKPASRIVEIPAQGADKPAPAEQAPAEQSGAAK